MKQIEVRDVHFEYQTEQEILKGLSFTIDQRPTAIIGQNGAGKSTLVKLIKGLIRPTKGKILINQEDIAQKTVAQIAKQVGLVFQNPDDQIFKHTVLDEVLFGPLQIGLQKKEAKTAAREALELLGLEGLEKVNPYDLGLSERKLVSIAAIIAMDTDIVIFDEPTIAQDAMGKQRIQHLIRRLREQGKLVISILHDMDFVAETFERVLVFGNGEVLLDGSTKEVFSHKDIIEEAALTLPTTAQLCYSLGCNELFLTPQDFIDDQKAQS
ncbi:energy-coupling factor ABC transporter ATP-binding protein [Streptococcus sp. DD13]|uniref:energy-coupling factor ABC transporter ATP-binding protein n=1 Tax=Streptococcus sp. DD13 TaxID=1777881 RepID=UPI000795BE87|nr:ABC transporter ATP-binding protein [Streptococcus sp. DD13]KXT78445.1 ATPase component of energizing module of queuosine-regulated ECF transporter [Streptococcus sp. DD13]